LLKTTNQPSPSRNQNLSSLSRSELKFQLLALTEFSEFHSALDPSYS
jgi:hypothetical protein